MEETFFQKKSFLGINVSDKTNFFNDGKKFQGKKNAFSLNNFITISPNHSVTQSHYRMITQSWRIKNVVDFLNLYFE